MVFHLHSIRVEQIDFDHLLHFDAFAERENPEVNFAYMLYFASAFA